MSSYLNNEMTWPSLTASQKINGFVIELEAKGWLSVIIFSKTGNISDNFSHPQVIFTLKIQA